MTPLELLPSLTTYAPGDDVVVEARGLDGAADVTVYHLGDAVAVRTVAAGGGAAIPLGALAPGGYGVELRSAGGAIANTAVHVADDPRRRVRYGFVADYRPDRDPAEVVDNARRLHLTAVQFYDWAYRHADLVGGGERYDDALGQEVSLDTVRRLIASLRTAGVASLGYAAVYAVGREDWPGWEHLALHRSTGEAYSLGDFLGIVDPAAPEWSSHFVADLKAATAHLGFDGFHLDQYGYPRRAVRGDGTVVDVARSFDHLIAAARAGLPDAQLVFNNVNDFPTWVTAHSAQDAVYIEVWPPHVTLGSLARVVARARAEGDGKPVVIAAYQHVYSTASVAEADLAASFTMATLFSHGATHLLAGEGDRVLVDPYYVHNHVAAPSTRNLLRRWYDFLVEHDELLVEPGIVDVTGAWVGGYNDAIDVAFDGVATTEEPVPGAVWRRVTEAGGHLVVHLINLVGQDDTAWDAPRRTVGCPGPAKLRIRRAGSPMPRVMVADPDRTGRLHAVEVHGDGEFAVAEIPAPHVWQIVMVDLDHDGMPP